MTDELRFERVIGTPPAWSSRRSPRTAGRRPSTGRTTRAGSSSRTATLRVGGVWTVKFGPARSHLYGHRHVFEVVDRPWRLVLATTESRPDGSSLDFAIEFTFEARDGKTLMTMTQSGFPTAELPDEHGRGVPNAFARLERAIHARK